MNKDPYIVPGEALIIILDGRYPLCVAKNGKDTKHTRDIAKIMNFVRNCEMCKMHKIDWCEGGLKLTDIYTMNVG